ncbi:hypothetical protein QCA50_009229 [Cerrena zonata]|uniref:Uncharacterized protein n=1 Tax=Cerrena zonata TaxID=2478898 RepID=A0AAW0G7I8_9APHY
MLAVFQIVVTKLTSSRVKWHSGVIATNANTNYNAGNVPPSNQNDDQSIHSEDTTQSYEIEYVDNYDIWDDSEQPPQEGPSSQVQPQPHHSTDHDPLPPPFVPHPGFSHDDYYPDEKS